ncbi:MAG: cytochrome c family protein [Alphaproteobacteria bacterium]|nr:cytochrome c family protein [Alphaproteobacteria bacterium]TAD87893.1 MAG: cytochrome c family protein [Alphaproteobacteria bacterium]
MSMMEWNKVFAAVLLAGIVFMSTMILGEKMVTPKPLAQNVVRVEGAAQATETAAAAPAAEAALEPVGPLLASADVAAGQVVARRCTSCHTFEKGGANRVGPNLWDIIGSDHAHAPGFAYSPVIAGMKGNPWDYEELNKFIANPRAYAPGTKMVFAGISRVQERANLIAWMRTLADTPKPLP